MMELKKIRSERIYDYLRKDTPIDISGYPLRDFTVISDENPLFNHHVLMLTDNDRGFSYLMVMQQNTTVEPDLDDMVLYIKELRDEVDGLYVKDGPEADIPLHLAINYRELQESGIDKYLDELAAIACGSRDHEPLPERLQGLQ